MIKRLIREYFLLWFMMVGRASSETVSVSDRVVLGVFILFTVVGVYLLPLDGMNETIFGGLLWFGLMLFQLLSIILIPFLFVLKDK